MGIEEDERPNPDALLAQVQAEERSQERGRLKIFFGAAPGVGKTYAMLRYGQQEMAKGSDVVVGIVETHQRSETQALADTLPILPRRRVPYKNITLEDFDLDAALARRPALLLVDELAHSNAPGLRHKKRWQDVEELLNAGIHVATTVNVQHLESVNETIRQITGIQVRETVPDRIIAEADELTLVDISDEDLLQRLKEGKVYLGEGGQRAMANFFRKGNLIALRQLALRLAADRVDLELRNFRNRNPEEGSRAGGRDRILVAVSGRPEDEHLVRATYHLATAQRVEWLAIHVDTPKGLLHRPQAQAWVWNHLHLAEILGAETARLTGVNVADEILAYANLRDVTQIVVGQSQGLRKFLWWWPGSLMAKLLSSERRMDVVIHPLPRKGAPGEERRSLNRQYLGMVDSPERRRKRNIQYLISAATGAALSGLAALMGSYHLGLAGIFVLYLLGAVGTALFYGRWPAIITLSVAVITYYSFGLSRNLPTTLGSLLSFSIILSLSLLISQLVARSREQETMARLRERRARNLYQLVQDLSRARKVEDILQTSIDQLHRTLGISVAFWLPPDNAAAGEHLHLFPEDMELPASKRHLFAAAHWSYLNKKNAGMSTDTLPDLPALFMPMLSGDTPLGVMMVTDLDLRRAPSDWLRFLETVTRLVGVALESARSFTQRREVDVRLRVEQLQNALLGAVSHDLRTPLAAVLGAATTLQRNADSLSLEERDSLIKNIRGQTEKMSGMVERILHMAALQSGRLELKKDWVPLDDLLVAARDQIKNLCSEREFRVRIPRDLPLLHVDPQLIEQTLANLLENACKYTPAGTMIEVEARTTESEIEVCVIDHGYGVPPGREEEIFTRFSQVKPPIGEGGSGLGLAICAAIVQLHGGKIWVRNRVMVRGAVFCFTLPLEQEPPAPAKDE
ncbi:MAG: ATP-binding protein [Acidithiobacillus sp.]|uniref:ATP-binding protein n=1 Tax=Acidithiobacillus sp. TaxID=1872118 RepID=UPI003D02471A